MAVGLVIAGRSWTVDANRVRRIARFGRLLKEMTRIAGIEWLVTKVNV
jgi:hypothetical protein